ncbi:porin [Microbulbifer sp. ZKSA006]|uniref:porin n=1 Tax=Microbulbifer sp. ZKSA006 TaxID=3243390 RepID=UPI0040390764
MYFILTCHLITAEFSTHFSGKPCLSQPNIRTKRNANGQTNMHSLKIVATSILLAGCISESYAESKFYAGLEHRHDSINGNLSAGLNAEILNGDTIHTQHYESSEIQPKSYNSWGIYLGYEFRPNVSVEAGYSQSNNQKKYFDDPNVGLSHGIGEVQLKHLSIDLLGKYNLKKYDKISLIGSLGISSREVDSYVQYETGGGCINEMNCNANVTNKDSDSSTNTRLQYGVGFQYSLGKSASTRLMLKQRINDPAESSYALSLGAQYHF